MHNANVTSSDKIPVIEGKINEKITWEENKLTSSYQEVWVIKGSDYWG